MNHHSTNHPPTEPEALEARFGLRIGAHLSAAADELPHDITERLRFAREQALARQRPAAAAVQPAAAPVVLAQGGPTLVLGSGGRERPRWGWLGPLLPLLALLLGLLAIEEWQWGEELREAAEIDSALLADDLPPAAYSDPGFAEFLKRTPNP